MRQRQRQEDHHDTPRIVVGLLDSPPMLMSIWRSDHVGENDNEMKQQAMRMEKAPLARLLDHLPDRLRAHVLTPTDGEVKARAKRERQTSILTTSGSSPLTRVDDSDDDNRGSRRRMETRRWR